MKEIGEKAKTLLHLGGDKKYKSASGSYSGNFDAMTCSGENPWQQLRSARCLRDAGSCQPHACRASRARGVAA
jgi:hypothetical protein